MSKTTCLQKKKKNQVQIAKAEREPINAFIIPVDNNREYHPLSIKIPKCVRVARVTRLLSETPCRLTLTHTEMSFVIPRDTFQFRILIQFFIPFSKRFRALMVHPPPPASTEEGANDAY
ncbi:hypothetical protein CEXT_22721 [Caerostris extrusa]|uniref:Uncharacterized protein n=1 Tax=Caerostris extrusa TaxID=172846 RepID=A0AAV4VBS2_CAEEX|nr:hypothetical protein CEXT_22721 [Caerostris extrusa]